MVLIDNLWYGVVMVLAHVTVLACEIDFDDKNDNFCDENSHIFYDYGDENDQKQTNTMPFKSKYTPFRHNYLVKKGPNQPGRGRPPPPPNGQCPFKIIFFFGTLP